MRHLPGLALWYIVYLTLCCIPLWVGWLGWQYTLGQVLDKLQRQEHLQAPLKVCWNKFLEQPHDRLGCSQKNPDHKDHSFENLHSHTQWPFASCTSCQIEQPPIWQLRLLLFSQPHRYRPHCQRFCCWQRRWSCWLWSSSRPLWYALSEQARRCKLHQKLKIFGLVDTLNINFTCQVQAPPTWLMLKSKRSDYCKSLERK